MTELRKQNEGLVLPWHEIEIEVPFADTDCQGIVWHGNYLRYFELARVQLFADCDLFSLIEEGSVQFVVSESYCKHYHPLRFRDRCTVRAQFFDIDHRLHMKFLIKKADGTKIAKGHTHVVSLNGDGKLQLVTPKSVSDRILEQAQRRGVDSAGRRHFIVATLALLSTLAGPSRAHAATLPAPLLTLLEKHEHSPGLYARFVEEKHISLVKVPLKNEGYMAYLRPGQFARVIEKPSHSKIVAHDDKLLFRQGDGQKSELSLENRPELRALVEGIVDLLSGNAARIERRYQIEILSCADSCRVRLVPKDDKMRALVSAFVVTVQEGRLDSFEVHEKSGDYSVTRLTSLELDRKFSEAEKKAIFSI